MRTVILLRHGESADKQHGQRDFDRVLTARGIASLKQLAAHLFNENLIPDSVLASPANRTQQTAQLVLTGLAANLIPAFEIDLYNGDDFTYQQCIEASGNDWQCLLVVGHNPSISALVGRLTQKPFLALSPGQAAILTFDKTIVPSRLVKTLGPF